MSAQPSKLASLAGLASTASGEARRDVLRQVAEAFRPENHALHGMDRGAFDALLAAVISELTFEIKCDLSRHVAASTISFRATAKTLAREEIAVARPVLERSTALTDADLVEVIAEGSQDHMLAVTRRTAISEMVSGALVERGNDSVVVSLLKNKGAEIGYPAYERVADRAEHSVALQLPFIQRESVPLDLLNDLYFAVEPKLRRELLARFDGVPLHELSIALLRSRRRWLMKYGALPQDYESARSAVEALARAGDLKPPVLVRFLRNGKPTEFKFAFARLTGTDYELVNRLIERQDIDGIGVLARAGRFERALFVTIAMLLAGEGQRMANVEPFGELYEKISANHAERVIAFWRVGTDELEPSSAAVGR